MVGNACGKFKVEKEEVRAGGTEGDKKSPHK